MEGITADVGAEQLQANTGCESWKVCAETMVSPI
jgi:hypothetical protein